jgi:Putative Ig domain
MTKDVRRCGVLLGCLAILSAVDLFVMGCAGTASSSGGANSAAKIASITPSSATVGATALTLQVKGSNFKSAATVLWSGMPLKTTFVSGSTLSANVSASSLASAATVSVSVVNDMQGAESNAMPFTIKAATPATLQIVTTSLPAAKSGSAYSATLQATGGTSPYHWSIASGTLPAGLSLDGKSGVISGNPALAGNFSFAVTVADSASTPSSAQVPLQLQVTQTPPPGPTASGFYGPGLGSDGLGNTTLGPWGNAVSYRMRAKLTGRLVAVHTYLIMDHPGYFGGNGGQVLVSVQTDDGSAAHQPSGTKLASSLLTSPLTVPTPARYFPTFNFANPPSISAGQLVHIVFENTDPNPSVNYVSVDSLYQAAAPAPSQPTMSDADCAVLLRETPLQGVAWKPRQGYSPIAQLEYEDGSTQGIGYMEAWVGAPQSINAGSSVREIFTVGGGDRDASSVAVRVARIGGNGALTVRLEDANGTLIEENNVPSASFPTMGSYVWAKVAFSTPHTLTAGKTYHLVLQASSGEYQAFPIRKGLAYGYQATTYFADGYAEFSHGGNWVGWTQWGVPNRTDGDLQFYFVTQ